MGNIESIIAALAQGYTYAATHPRRDQTSEVYERLHGLIRSRCADDRRPQVVRGYELYATCPGRPEIWAGPLGDSLRLLGADTDGGLLRVAYALASRLPGGSRIDYDEDDRSHRIGGDVGESGRLSYRNPGRPGVPDEDEDEGSGRGAGDPTIPDEDYAEEDRRDEADAGAY